MEPDPRGSSFQYLLIDVRTSLRYYVESKGVRSGIYSVKVLDLAKVETIDLTYDFPAYTGMAPKVLHNEGDISALKGTNVSLKIHLSRAAQSARLLFDDQSTLDLAHSGAQDFAGNFALSRSGSYVVQISEARGKNHAGSPEYEMEAIEDAAPKITVVRPMRDVRATSVEEVFSEIKAEDDIGMGKLELHYSVNGGPEKAENLYNGKPAQPSVTGTHTFFLEEFGLQPGDVISYYRKVGTTTTSRVRGCQVPISISSRSVPLSRNTFKTRKGYKVAAREEKARKPSAPSRKKLSAQLSS